MYRLILRLWVLLTGIVVCSCSTAHTLGSKTVIVVNGKGGADFRTIQEAINSLPDSSVTPRTIRIRSGIYQEKLFISKHNIILEGEDRDRTIITQDIARDEWRCDHGDDWGVATMNLDGNDITLKNLTVANEYGFHFTQPRMVNCAADPTGKKLITVNSHQMALRSMRTTRLKAVNCRFRAYAGDTVSPWNTTNGMFYFRDCKMEGGVDFYCPRGWAWAENCSFFANTGPASIWHDGTGNPDFKTVLKNCSFDGYPGFKLGRYHREAQFYLVDCRFTQNMSDADIYFVPGNSLQWGRRVYYANCNREGGNFEWFRDNLQTAKGQPSANDITVDWLFGSRWKPQVD